MLKKIVCAVLVATGLVALPLLAHGLNLQKGKWEITSEMKGMPMAVPPTTHVQCLGQEDTIPQMPQDNKDCKMVSQQVKGDAVFWTMECNNAHGKMVSNGKIEYKGSTFDGVIHISVKDSGNGSMELTNVLHGKRIGACSE